MSFAVPGYVVEELIGFGGSGEVWRARVEATGEPVALKRLRSGADPAARDRLRREAALLSGLAGPHVVALRDLVLTPDGPVLVLDYAAGGSVAGLLAARGRLDPGEVVTLGLPLARTLADLHARGVVHGDLSPSNLLLTGDGRPMLADLGVARLVDDVASGVHGTDGYVDPSVRAGGVPTAASDIWALGTVLAEALGAPDRPEWLIACLDADPEVRPSATELARQLAAFARAVPIRMPTTAAPTDLPTTAPVTPLPPAASPPPAKRRRQRVGARLIAAGLAGAVLVAGAVVVGVLWASASGPEAASTPRAVPVDWRRVLADLDAARDQAFLAGDPNALTDAYAPGSPALAVDSARLQQVLEQRLVVRGLALHVVQVTPLSVDAQRAVVAVRDRLPPYELLDGAGRLVSHTPARPDADWRIELVRVAGAWRIRSVVAG